MSLSYSNVENEIPTVEWFKYFCNDLGGARGAVVMLIAPSNGLNFIALSEGVALVT